MNLHQSVLKKEVIEALNIRQGETYIDATINGGGHSKEILNRGGLVFGIDLDQTAIKGLAKELNLKVDKEDGVSAKGRNITVVKGSFSDIKALSKKYGVWETSGILFDLGLSSNQLDDSKRGFSFSKQGPLDMRMDLDNPVAAVDLVNALGEKELYDLFSRYGEEHASRRFARAVVDARVKKPITTTQDLAEVIELSSRKKTKIHPATRVFQALRIAVNNELNNLSSGLEGAASILKKEGRLVVISFHSLEDRIVKNFFKEEASLNILTKKPITPSKEEIEQNPRSRSAKLRVAVKI